MFEGHRVVLESRVKVRLGQVPGVTGFGEETQVGEIKFTYQAFALGQVGIVIFPYKARMDQKQPPQGQDTCEGGLTYISPIGPENIFG